MLYLSDSVACDEVSGQGFLMASCIFTQRPLGPLTLPNNGQMLEIVHDSMVPISRTFHNYNSLFRINLEDLEILCCNLFISHIPWHLFSGVDS